MSHSCSPAQAVRSVLYVAAEFPPLNTIGAIRNWNVACQLAARGWNLTILTIPPSLWLHRNADAHPEPYRPGGAFHYIHASPPFPFLNPGLYKPAPLPLQEPLHALLLSRLNPFKRVIVHAWYFPACRAARSRLTEKPHLILSSGGPLLSSFLAAYSLAKHWRIPYVLDYRDLWTTGNPHKRTIHNYWQRPIERRILKHAATIVTVSNGLALALARAFDLPPHRVHVLTNGYNPHVLADVQPMAFEEPAVVYAGTLYPPLVTLQPVFAALKVLDKNELRWRFHYYGSHTDLVRKHAAEAGIAARVRCHGRVPWSVAAAALKGAHCAIVVVSVTTGASTEQGVLTGKLFELLGLGVPILLIAPRNAEARDYLFGHGQAYCADEVTEIATYLKDLIEHEPKRYAPPKECCWDTLGDAWDRLLRSVCPGTNACYD